MNRKNRTSLGVPALVAGLLLAVSGSTFGATFTWSGSSTGIFGDNNWGNIFNWEGLVLPASAPSTDLVFGASARTAPVQNMVNPFVLNSLEFAADAPGYTLGGGGLRFMTDATAPAILVNSTVNQLIGQAIAFDTDLFVDGAAPEGTVLTLSGARSGTGRLWKSGDFTLALTAPSTSEATVLISRGVLRIGHADALSMGTLQHDAGGLEAAPGVETINLGALSGKGTILIGSTNLTMGLNDASTQFIGKLTLNKLEKAGLGQWRTTGQTTAEEVSVTEGELLLTGTGIITASVLNVAPGAGAAALLTIDGKGIGTPTQATGLTTTVSGDVDIRAGGRLNAVKFDVVGGGDVDIEGINAITGARSTLAATSAEVGGSSAASVSVSGGALMTAHLLDVVSGSFATGTVSVSGVGLSGERSELQASEKIRLRGSATSGMSISDGAIVSTPAVIMTSGANLNIDGVHASGVRSTLVSDLVRIGTVGTEPVISSQAALLRLANGGAGEATTTIIGASPGSGATARLVVEGIDAETGIASSWSTSSLSIGIDGTGELLVLDGALATTNSATVGAQAGLPGTLRVAGAADATGAPALLTASTLWAGPGVGTVQVETGGAVQVLGHTLIGNDDFLNILGGSFTTKTLEFAAGATANFAFGHAAIGADQTIAPGSAVQWLLGGSAPTLGVGRSLQLGGETTLLMPLVIDGGAFFASEIANPWLVDLKRGTLRVKQSGIVLGGGGDYAFVNDLGAQRRFETADGALIPSGGEFRLAGGTLASDGLVNHGRLAGHGSVEGDWTNESDGTVFVPAAGALLLSQGTLTNHGRISVPGGTIDSTGAITNATAGRLSGHGTFRAAEGFDNSGLVELSGVADIFGPFTNESGGHVLVTGGRAATFYDEFVHAGEFTIAPFTSAVFLGDFSGDGAFLGEGTAYFHGAVGAREALAVIAFEGSVGLRPTTTLSLRIGSEGDALASDRVSVGGHLAAAGVLEVLTPADRSGFAFGDEFRLLEFHSASGAFSELRLPTLSGALSWDATGLLADGVLRVVPAPGTGVLSLVALFVAAGRGRRED